MVGREGEERPRTERVEKGERSETGDEGKEKGRGRWVGKKEGPDAGRYGATGRDQRQSRSRFPSSPEKDP